MLKLSGDALARLCSRASAGTRLSAAVSDVLESSSHTCAVPYSSHVLVRTKTFTSNVMDETRSQRVRDHFAYHKKLKAWRLEIHQRVEQWRHELRSSEVASTAAEQQAHTQQALRTKRETQQSVALQHINKLEEELRKAQLEHDVAQLRLQKAHRAEAREAKLAKVREQRRQHLLEASKQWVGSSRELQDRINTALDNPKPFGFITNLPRTTL